MTMMVARRFALWTAPQKRFCRALAIWVFLIHYYLARAGTAFDFVVLAEESPRSANHGAVIWTGASGRRRFRELMRPRKPWWRRAFSW